MIVIFKGAKVEKSTSSKTYLVGGTASASRPSRCPLGRGCRGAFGSGP